jgi:hypothetical protein
MTSPSTSIGTNRGTARDLPQQEEHLFTVVSSERFLKMEGLNNEVPFFIYPYPPHLAFDVTEVKKHITNRLQNRGVRVREINLYDLAIGLLKSRGVWDRLLAAEPGQDKADFRELLQGMLDPHDHLAPAIRNRLTGDDSDIVFLTGTGEVFPYIRIHTVLENLQSVITQRPLLVWFPGSYEFTPDRGHQLRVLDLHPDSYYRAINILDLE